MYRKLTPLTPRIHLSRRDFHNYKSSSKTIETLYENEEYASSLDPDNFLHNEKQDFVLMDKDLPIPHISKRRQRRLSSATWNPEIEEESPTGRYSTSYAFNELRMDSSESSTNEDSPAIRSQRCIRKSSSKKEESYTKYFHSNHIKKSIDQSKPSTEVNDYNTKEIELSTIVETSEVRKKKYHFCFYCKKRIINIGRHLETHSDEVDVQKFLHLRKGTKERRAIIDLIRKKGDAEQNRNKDYNNGTLIVCRRPQEKKQRTALSYECCPRCLGYFSKLTFRRHYIKCIPNVKKGDRSAMVNGRRVRCQIHSRASDTLRNKIFPVMREDDVTRIIRYDELAILYGNKLCEKYKSPHHHKMIRSRLRAVGNFMIQVKKHSHTISDFASCFDPKYINVVFKAINALGGINELGIYNAPSTVFDTGTMFRKCANLLDKEYMISKKKNLRSDVSDFLLLFNDDFSTSITNAVNETKLQMRRRKKVILPDIHDIKKLNMYLRFNRRSLYKKLLEEYDFQTWKNLASFTLISIQIFNRRRPGEIERIHIDDFLNYQEVNEQTDKDIYRNLSEDAKRAAKQYVRIELRGKLARCVSVLMHKEIVNCLKLILKHRKRAGVPSNNHYLFGLPSVGERLVHLDACVLIRKYSKLCGASNAELLRGTQLRKHIATHSVTMDLQETEVADLANFMGHAEKIHREHYRLPIVTREIANISKFLLAAQGEDEPDDIDEVGFEDVANLDSTEPADLTTRPLDSSNTPYKSERSVSPLGRTNRRSWTTPERTVMKKLFEANLKSATLPSLNTCASAVGTNKVLKCRTAAQVKAWVNNTIQKNKRMSVPTTVRQWRTPERRVAKDVFARYLKSRRLPSLTQCETAITEHPELNNRKPAQLKAFINNEIQRQIKTDTDTSIRRRLFN